MMKMLNNSFSAAITFSITAISAFAMICVGQAIAREPQFKLDLGKAFQTLKSAKNAIVPLTEEEEITLGQSITSNLMSLAPLYEDQEIQAYVNKVGRWVSMHSERPDLPWTFAVLNNDDVNAFASPGGYIIVTKGLLQLLKSEAELAGVLGHEIGHVVRKHHLNAIQKENAASALKNGASLLMDAKGKSNQDVLKYLSAGTAIYGKGLDKEDEFESDRLGVVLAARAGYDPYGLPAALQQLQSITGSSAGLQLMMETHPKTSDRLTALDKVMGIEFEKFENQPSVDERFKKMMLKIKTEK